MATEGYVKFEYFSKGVSPFYNSGGFPELLDDEKITIESPCLELNYHQYAAMFKKFLMALGFDQKNVIQAGCSIAFAECNSEKLMREVAEEYEVIMSEDLPDIIQDRIKQDAEWIEKHNESWEKRYWALYHRFSKLAHLTDDDLEETAAKYRKRNDDLMPPWGHSDMEALKYTDEELDAMCEKAASDEEKRKCQEYNLREAEYYNKRAQLDVQANSPYNDGWTQQAYKDELEKLEDPEYLKKDRNSNFPGENTICDANDPSDECKEHWNDFWEEDSSNNNMWEQGMLKVTTNDPMKAWNGLVPGSPEAKEAGCICPILDNEEMPDDKKWIDVECSIHGRKK